MGHNRNDSCLHNYKLSAYNLGDLQIRDPPSLWWAMEHLRTDHVLSKRIVRALTFEHTAAIEKIYFHCDKAAWSDCTVLTKFLVG